MEAQPPVRKENQRGAESYKVVDKRRVVDGLRGGAKMKQGFRAVPLNGIWELDNLAAHSALY